MTLDPQGKATARKSTWMPAPEILPVRKCYVSTAAATAAATARARRGGGCDRRGGRVRAVLYDIATLLRWLVAFPLMAPVAIHRPHKS